MPASARFKIILIAFAALSVSAYYFFVVPPSGTPLIDLHAHERAELQRRAAEARVASEAAYVKRLRDDAIARIVAEDYENALRRLDEAEALDPVGDTTVAVVKERQFIAKNVLPIAEITPSPPTPKDIER
jgi:hypothetical protein